MTELGPRRPSATSLPLPCLRWDASLQARSVFGERRSSFARALAASAVARPRCVLLSLVQRATTLRNREPGFLHYRLRLSRPWRETIDCGGGTADRCER